LLCENGINCSKPVQFTEPPLDGAIALTATFEEHEHIPIEQRWWNKPDNNAGISHALAGLEQDQTALDETHLVEADKRLEADVWGEEHFLTYLQSNEYPINTTDAQKHLYRKRAKSYRTWGDKIFRVLADGVEREVPKPEDRVKLITDSHERTGHFGQRRTLHLLSLKYWWKGRKSDVATVLQKCDVCDRVKASFNAQHPVLQPLPIEGMFYRWGIDLCGPFDVTPRGNKYLMICIEHFSKWCEIIPIKDKLPTTTRDAFVAAVLTRFGSPAEVVTDRGGEFESEFAQTLMECFIDHRTTSADHPQSDGLAERMVQTMKFGLKKHILASGKPLEWDLNAHWVALGYRSSVQASTGFSPYEMLFGLDPVVPPAQRESWGDDVDFLDNADKALESWAKRGIRMKDHCIVAGGNLKIAQHRDKLHYAKMRGGGLTSIVRKFAPGMYVYVRRLKEIKGGLSPLTKPAILKIKQVLGNGTLLLQGKCTSLIKAHVEQCAPCHLPNIDPRLDPELYRPDRHSPCEVCKMTHNFAEMLLCDRCNSGWHTFCMDPPVSKDVDTFVCPHCEAGGFSPLSPLFVPNLAPALPKVVIAPILEQNLNIVPPPHLKERQLPKPVEPRWATPSTRPSPRISAQLADHLRCTSYHDRVVVRTGEDYQEAEILWGKVAYLGKQFLPRALDVSFENGKVERMTANQVSPILCEEGIEMPKHNISLPAVASTTLNMLPATWPLDQSEKLQKALRILMPVGQFRTTEITSNASRMPGLPGYNEFIRVWARRGPPLLILNQLRRILRLNNVPSWLDPCASSCKLAKLLISTKHKVLTNEYYPGNFNGDTNEANFRLDPTQPSTFQTWQDKGHCVGGFISIPLPRLLDVVLPLAALTTALVTCFYVPCPYLTSPTQARLEWIKSLQQENRLLIIMGIPREASIAESSGVWMCIFRDTATRSALVDKKYYRANDCCVFAD
jgi:hypothetical protein